MHIDPGCVVAPRGVRYDESARRRPCARSGIVTSSKQTPPTPLVSCIIPVFNGAAYLREALDSVLRQTRGPVEIVVADDGSTDATADIVAAYGDRVIYLRQDNAGPAAARNLGLRRAGGEYIGFLDADDLWHEEKIERQLERLLARPEFDLCFAHAQNFWIPELRDEEARFRAHRIAQPLPAYLTSSLLARRRVFDVVGEFDPSMLFGHSTEWYLRAVARGVAAEMLPDVLYFRRLHHGNRSRLMNEASRDEFLHLVKAHLDRRRRAAAGSSAGPKKPDAGD